MVKPQSLWAAFKTATDSKELGDICRKLGGQNVELSAGAQMTYGVILMDNEWHTESIEAQREKDRKRQAESRARRAEEAARKAEGKSGTGAATVTPSAAGAAVSAHAGAAATVAPVAGIGAAAVDWSKVEITDDAIMSSPDDAILMAAKLTGDTNNPQGWGWWRQWVREYPNGDGEAVFRESLFTFSREMRAGENAGRKPAAVFTARLKKMFNPDKKKQGGAA